MQKMRNVVLYFTAVMFEIRPTRQTENHELEKINADLNDSETSTKLNRDK